MDVMLAVGRVVWHCRSVSTFASAEVPVMSGWNERSSEEGEGIPTPRRPGNVIVFPDAATEAQGGAGPQEWKETDALPPNVREPPWELL